MPDNFLEALDDKEEGEKRYHKSNFRYDEAKDIYICPEGSALKRWAEQKREGKTGLCQAWIYSGAGVRRDKVGWQEAIDGPA